jgi:hypothetical protein
MDKQMRKEIATVVDLIVDGLSKAYREKMKTVPAPADGHHYVPRIKSVTVEIEDTKIGVSMGLELKETKDGE